jgi:DNA-binding NtrC family response regulator
MSYRHTAIGFAGRVSRERQRAELLEVLDRTAANMVRTAHELGIGRRHLYKLVHRASLFTEIEEIRDRRRRFLTPETPWTSKSPSTN